MRRNVDKYPAVILTVCLWNCTEGVVQIHPLSTNDSSYLGVVAIFDRVNLKSFFLANLQTKFPGELEAAYVRSSTMPYLFPLE
jgi:hypothetical protein